MSRQYQNIIDFVSPFGYYISTPKEEYVTLPQDKRIITFECKQKHSITLGHAVFINKKSKFSREKLDMDDFCSICVSLKEKEKSEQKFIEEIELKTSHSIIHLDNQTREVIYRCGNCGEKNHSFISSLKVNTGLCHHCQNSKSKLDYDNVKTRIEEKGFKIITKKDEYSNNKKVFVICPCSNSYESTLFDITRGRLCIHCKQDRTKITCLEKYGEDNVSKVPEIFEKIQSSLFKRKIVILPKTKRELTVMGYEPQAISFLLEQEQDKVLYRKIEEDDILVGKEVPRFRYETDDGKEHIYFPDIFIRNSKVIIEVKSIYTFHYHVRINYLKFKKVVEEGYTLRLIMFMDYKMNMKDIICKTLEDLEQIVTL
jgi:hypothetical protein